MCANQSYGLKRSFHRYPTTTVNASMPTRMYISSTVLKNCLHPSYIYTTLSNKMINDGKQSHVDFTPSRYVRKNNYSTVKYL